MGNKRKQARRAARQALKSKSRILGYEIDTIIVDELASAAPALPPKPKRDTSSIEARNEAQAHYLISLDSKALTFATGEAGCGKTFLATAVAAQRLLDKEVDRIIVTRPVLQAEEDLGFLPGDMAEVRSVLSSRLRCAAETPWCFISRILPKARGGQSRDRPLRIHARSHVRKRCGHPR